MNIYDHHKISKGDILVDRHGNKMVVLDPLTGKTGGCYVLLNGRVKLINALSSLIIRKEAISSGVPARKITR